jgi:hypothetical protein
VYLNDPSLAEKVKGLLAGGPGIQLILDKKEQANYHIDHPRSGDLVLMADARSWFTYYFWLDDAKAPDYARVVDIHKKPGYDPVEMFMTSKLRAAYKLLRKKAGFRYVMDVIPLDAGLVKGSHGSLDASPDFYPLLITDAHSGTDTIQATDVYGLIWNALTKGNP